MSVYILHIPDRRRHTFAEFEGNFGRESLPFGEPVPYFSTNGSPVVLVSIEPGLITHIANGEKGTNAGTGLRKIYLRDIASLGAPIPFQSLVQLVNNRVRARVETTLNEGGALPEGSSVAAMSALRELLLDPNLLNDYPRHTVLDGMPERQSAALAQQKEAVATALEISGLDREGLTDWQRTDRPQSFLDGLPEARLREDQMIQNDLRTFPGFEEIRNAITNSAVFENDQTRLTVLVANRTPLEEQFGTDLIYYNEQYESFVMVQYKAMETESGGEAVYRLPDAQLQQEIERMERTLAEIATTPPSDGRDAFRFSDNPFFFKLCPRLEFNPDSSSLTKGMYIPLSYWRQLESDPAIVGPRGGQRITYPNVGRYLNNTEFASLVRSAWIGTHPQQSRFLAPLVRRIVAEGRAAVIAINKRRAPEETDF